ncbi:pentapeptide repeat-containing protein [Streptomyces sp. NBC_00555]|uniref:pentapeptide repeat-containing protein n=1 Tax=Streptomyces sp. NBC_00555 TaxID=2903662 RepID=UPI00338DA983
MTGADLTSADLTGANLSHADLAQADLSGTRLDGVSTHDTNGFMPARPGHPCRSPLERRGDPSWWL